jgi:hypothetical protein
MVAAKATSLMVAMAVLGVVPVAAHAQTIDILELVDQEVSEEQVSAPNQEESAANVDEDTFMPTNIVFATVGPFGTLNVDFTSTINDEDALANSQTETQSADINQIPTLIQSPTFTIDDLLGLLPA